MPQTDARTPPDAPAHLFVLFEDGCEAGRALLFSQPEEIIVANEAFEVTEACARMEAATKCGVHLDGKAMT